MSRNEDPLKKRARRRAWYLKNAEHARAYGREYYRAHVDEKKAHDKEYRAANSAHIHITQKAYNDAHAEEKRAYAREYARTHTEQVRSKNKQWQLANKEYVRAKAKEYRAKNRARRLAQMQAWSKANPEKRRADEQRRRMQQAGASVNDLTAAQWAEIQAAYNYRCVYCPPDCWWCNHKKHALTRDHIDAVIHGGPNTYTNIVPACRSHNSEKYIGPPLNPVQPLLLIIAPSKPKKRRK
jgi:hypothetical protein